MRGLKYKGDGTILDKNTGLIWMQDANISTLPLPYEGARQYLAGNEQRQKAQFRLFRLAASDD